MLKKFEKNPRVLFNEALFQLAPLLAVVRTNRRVQEPTQERMTRWETLPRETLLKVIAEEWERAKTLDDKLIKTTAALSIAGTVGGAASRPLLDGLATSPMKSVVFVCLLFSVVSLFSGVVMGFAGLRPKPRGGIGPDFAVKTQDEGQVSKRECTAVLSGFEVSNLKRANEAEGANVAIRNGILSFVLATLVAMFAPRAIEKPSVPSLHVDSFAPVIVAPALPKPVPSKMTDGQQKKN